MSRRYDSKTNTFTSDGRLLQVEYAVDAINKAGAAVGVLSKEGIVLASQKQDPSTLLEQSKFSEKIFSIDKHAYCVVSGLTADANYLIDIARLASQRYRYVYQSDMPIEELLVRICDLKQSYTQYGGKRPFGTAFIFAGYDKNYKFQLYNSEPSGNYFGWKAYAIGQNNLAANSYLKQEYKEDLNLDQALVLGLKALIKTMDTTTPSPNKIEITQITVDANNEVLGKTLNEKEIKQLLVNNGYSFDEELK